MTTPDPSGPLSWGQAGNYDAVEDRAVIAAVTGNRTGLCWPVTVTAGPGLELLIAGGWLGVAGCGDLTSAVVGSRLSQTVEAIPGPPAGERRDRIWCDVYPDEAIWRLKTYPAADTAARPGIALADVIVPANATLASQMDVIPADSGLERKLVGIGQANRAANFENNAWDTAPSLVDCTAVVEPGQWYRVRFTSNSVQIPAGSICRVLRIGVGWTTAGEPESAARIGGGSSVSFESAAARPQGAEAEWVFRYPADAERETRVFHGRIWRVDAQGAGPFTPQSWQATFPGLVITVEDAGS